MKLAKALRFKNTLVNEVKELQNKLIDINSYNPRNEPKWSGQAVADELTEKKAKLLELKTAITTANVGIANEIHQMEELKASISFWQQVSTKEGTFTETRGYNDDVVEATYAVTFDAVATEQKVKELRCAIEEIQDKLTAFNFSTDISLSF